MKTKFGTFFIRVQTMIFVHSITIPQLAGEILQQNNEDHFHFCSKAHPQTPNFNVGVVFIFLVLVFGGVLFNIEIGGVGYFLHPRTCETVAIFLLPSVEDCLFLVFILGGRVVYVSFEQAFLNPFYFIVWVVPIFCFCSESVPHVYVHRASDLRGLLQPTASPRVEAVQDSIQGHRIYSCVHS